METLHETNYYQWNDTWGLDHYSIEVSLNEKVDTYKKNINKISTKKTDWTKYKVILQQKDKDIKNLEINEENWESAYDEVINELKEAVILATRGTIEKKS